MTFITLGKGTPSRVGANGRCRDQRHSERGGSGWTARAGCSAAVGPGRGWLGIAIGVAVIVAVILIAANAGSGSGGIY
jgi:hypothetical protein